MIRPLQSHDALLADILASDRRDSGFRLWWLGQSGFLLQWQGIHVLLDPYLSDSLTQKYNQTDKPHVRMTELVIDPARFSMADIAASTHNHTDHLDAESLRPILAANPSLKLVIAETNRAFVADRLKIDRAIPIGVDDGAIEAKLVIPCHFEMFEFNSASPDEFIRECRKLGQSFKVLHCGEQWHS